MNKKLLPIILIAGFILSYTVWLFWFNSTSLVNIQCDNQSDALLQVYSYKRTLPGSKTIISTSGTSNNMWGSDSLQGYIIIDKDVKFENLKSNMFVIYKSPKGLIHHRLRHKTEKGWIAEGDGNTRADKYIVTKDNYVGITYESKVWRY